MSKTIDEKVVEMRFDNKQFESNVATSMSTLEKLKKSLKLDGATKGLEDIDSAAKRVDMSGLGGAVDSVKAKFSALDVIAITALANITNQAVNAGTQLAKSLSIDQISAGWQKFSDKTTSVATLVAQGNAIEDVNAQLDRLNWFTDETSYNFTEMVSNIAKFTASGKGLEESVTAMEGIATWAALSGQNAATASRAMYQLSQAMGAGVMRKEDYKSIQNASMDTEEFRQKCLDAAVALGTLKNNGDGTYTSLIEGADDSSFTISQFADNLTKNLWLTSDVMMSVFTEYASAVEAIYTAADENGMLASEVIDEIRQKANELKTDTMTDSDAIDAAIRELGYTLEDGSLMFDSFGLKAFEAAQKARTFQDAIDSVKDAVSTGWMNTFELLFGNAEKATELWTDVANQLWDVFAGGGERRNEILGIAMASKWDSLIEKIEEAGGSTEDFESKLKETAVEHGAVIDDLIKEYGSLDKVLSSGKLSKGIVIEAIEKLSGTFTKTSESVEITTNALDHFQDIIDKVARGEFGHGTDRINRLTEAGENAAAIQELLNRAYIRNGYHLTNAKITIEDLTEVIGDLSVEQLENTGYTEEEATALKALAEEAKKTGTPLNELIENLTRPSGQELIFDIIHNSLASISGIISTFREAWADIFPSEQVADGLYNALSAIQKATEKMVTSIENNADKLKSTFKGIIAIFDILTDIVGGSVKAAFEILGEIFGSVNTDILGVTGSIGDVIVAFRDWLKENEIITKGFNKLVRGAKTVINIIKRWIAAFKGIPSVQKAIDGITAAFEKFTGSAEDMDGTMSKVKEWFATFEESSVVQTLLAGLSKAFKWFGSTIEDVIVALGEWFEVFKQTEGVQLLIEAVNNLVEALGKLFSGELDANDFATVLGDSLAKLLVSLPKMAIQIGKDFIAGFANGLGDGISDVISSILEFCSNFISAFASALGIHSPSTISYQNAIDWWQGFINGCKEMLGPVIEAIQPFIDFIKNIFTSLWDYITDESGNLDWGKLITGGITIESLIILKQLTTAIEKFANAATSFSSIFSSISGVFTAVKTAITNIGKAAAHDFNATAVLKMAGAIAILAASIWLLCQIDSIGKAWNAVAIIGVLALIVMGLAFALNQLGSASLSFSAATKQLDLKGLKAALLQIGITLLMMAIVVKMIGDMDPEAASRGLKSLGAMAVGLLIFVAALGGISLYAKDISGFVGMAVKLSLAMLLMVGVCKLAGQLSAEELLKGIVFGAAFAIFVRSITAVAKTSGNNVGKVGSMVIGVAVAMTLMIGVCKLAGKLSAEEMLKGAAFATAFTFFVRELVTATKLGKKQKIAELSGLLLSVSFSLAMMVGVCKLVGMLSVDEMIKGGLAIAAFAVLMRRMIDVVKIGEDVQIAKVSATLIGMSTAVMLLAGTAVILGMVDLASLAKGVTAVAILGSIVSLMAYSLKGIASATGAADVKVTMIALAATVAIMAGAIVALSQIKDRKELWGAVAAMSILMGVFTLMISSIKLISGVTIPLGPLLALGGIVLILTGVIAALSYVVTDAKAVLAGAGSIAGLLLVMVGVLAILGVMSIEIGPAMIGTLALAALGLVLRELVWVLASMSDIDNALSNVGALSALFGALVGMLGVMAIVGSLIIGSGGMGLLAIVTGLGTLALTALAIKGGVALFKSIAEDLTATMKELANASKEAKGIDVNAFDGVPRLLSIISQIGTTSLRTGIKDFFTLGGTTMDKFQRDGVAFFKAMGAIGEAASEVKIGSDAKDNIENVLSVAEGLVGFQQSLTGITGFIGWLRGVQGLDTFGENAKTFFEAMSTAMNSVGDVTFKKPNILFVISTAKTIGEIQQSLTGIEGFIGWLRGVQGLDTFGENAKTFFEAMSTAMNSETLGTAAYNKDGISYIIDVSNKLATLQSSLPGVEGFADWLNRMYGDGNLANFGENAKGFFEGMSTAMSSVGDEAFNESSIEYIISIAGKLAELQTSLQGVEGFISWLDKMSNNLATFGINAQLFFTAMSTAMSSVGDATFKKPNILFVVSTAQKLADLQTSFQGVEGFINWLDKISNNLKTFGTNAATFFTAMSTAMSSIGDEIFKKPNILFVISTAQKLADLQTSLQGVEGFIGWLDKMSSNLGTFGTDAATFFTAMSTAMSSIGGELTYNTESLDSILAVATKLAEFQEDKLQGVEGFMDWLDKISNNAGTFGINASTFIKNLDLAMSALGEGEYNSEKLGSMITFAYKLKYLINALTDLDDSGVKTFAGGFASKGAAVKIAEAIGEFGNQTGEINLDQMNLVITAAYKLKYLINALTDLDDSGVKTFAGGLASKGAAVKIAETMANFGKTVGEINTDKMSTAVSSATKLKDLINGLVDIDTSGIDKFKVDAIATEMKGYANKVAEIDTATVSSSITSASRLKTFVAGLSKLDSSGISNFKIGSIGQSLATYSRNVSGFNGSQVATSIVSANKLKNFISSLSGLDTGGVGTFKSAVEELATVNIGAVVEAFSGASESMTTIGMNLITALSNGMRSGSATIRSTTALVVSVISSSIKSKSSLLTTAGKTLIGNLASGISSSKSVVSNAAGSSASAGVSAIQGYYRSFFQAGNYLVTGFARGIELSTWVAKQAARQMANDAKEAAEAALDENSPSKVFMKIGGYVAEGFAIGISDLSYKSTDAAEGMASSAINSTRTAMSTLLDAINTDMDAQPTIRPVVDLSNVQTGVNAINGLFNTTQSVGVQANLNAIGYSMNAMRQNGKNDDVISAINKLNDKLDGVGNTYNTINGVTYDDGSNVTDAIETLVRYAKIGGRV